MSEYIFANADLITHQSSEKAVLKIVTEDNGTLTTMNATLCKISSSKLKIFIRKTCQLPNALFRKNLG